MLCYENVVYEDIKETCIVQELEMIIDANTSAIKKFSLLHEIDIKVVKKQIRLLAPQFNKRDYNLSHKFFEKKILPILDKNFKNYKENFEEYSKNAGVKLLNGKVKISKKEIRLKDFQNSSSLLVM